MPNPLVIRLTAYFQGRVQGVGFRGTTAQLAKHHPITGYVQNLHDGRVLLVVEGQPSHIDTFVTAVTTRLADHIAAVETQRSAATFAFRSFVIRQQ